MSRVVEVWWKGMGPSKKKIILSPKKMISLSAFWQFLTVTRKPWDTDFTVQSWNELKQNYPKVHSKSQTGGGTVAASLPPEYIFSARLKVVSDRSVTIVLVADGSMWLIRWLQSFVVQLQCGHVEPVERQSLQIADADDLRWQWRVCRGRWDRLERHHEHVRWSL